MNPLQPTPNETQGSDEVRAHADHVPISPASALRHRLRRAIVWLIGTIVVIAIGCTSGLPTGPRDDSSSTANANANDELNVPRASDNAPTHELLVSARSLSASNETLRARLRPGASSLSAGPESLIGPGVSLDDTRSINSRASARSRMPGIDVKATTGGNAQATKNTFIDIADAPAVAPTKDNRLFAQWPMRADRPFVVGAGSDPRDHVTIDWAGDKQSGAELVDGTAIYRNIHVGTDALVVAQPERTEVFYMLHDDRAPRRWSWTLGPSTASLKAYQDGPNVVLVDGEGSPRLTISAPGAVDAKGVHHNITTRLQGQRITFDLERDTTTRLSYPVLVDPVIETVTWVRAASTLSPRRALAMAYDSARRRTVAFGGSNSIQFSAGSQETFEWNGTAWSRVESNGSTPSAREGHAMAFDSVRNRTVLFGGWNSTNAFADTWEWNGSTWVNVTPAGAPGSSPPARQGHSLTFDSARGRTVLVGGRGATGTLLDDTWEWNGTTWTNVTPASTKPSARAFHAAAYDATRGRTVLFGGVDAGSTRLSDTWEFNGATATWSLMTSATTPPARSAHAMAFDSSRKKTVMFAGTGTAGERSDTWEWNGTTWSSMTSITTSPSARAGLAAAFHADGNVTLVFGGASPSTDPPFGDTWAWNGVAWTDVTPAQIPSARTGAAAAFDATRARTIMFGGRGAASGVYFADTWEWNGSAWRNVTPTGGASASPSARAGHAMTFDSARGRIVLFGGIGPSGYLADTWEWDGSAWTNVTPAGSPPVGPSARSEHAMAFDSARNRSILFGGIDASLTENSETWEWNGTAWLQSTPSTSPPSRRAHGMAFDSARGRTVIFGGTRTSAGTLNDTWEYNGATSSWSNVTPPAAPSSSPSVRTGASLVYDASRSRAVLFGGTADPAIASPLNDTWEWNGSAWSTLTASFTNPAGRWQHAASYDSWRKRMVIFGGGQYLRTNDNYTYLVAQDTWELAITRAVGSTCSSAAQCATGFCVDGVCCESACGGGSTNDCVACSTAAGSVADGTCSPLNATACNDSNACTLTDTCVAGTCVGSTSPCSAGSSCANSGASYTCGACPAGTISTDGSGATSCVPCTSGYAPAGATECFAWTTCFPGTYVSAEGTATTDRRCTPCPAGTTSTQTNASTCTIGVSECNGSNNWAPYIAGQPCAGNGYTSVDYTYEYAPSCPAGFRVQWGYLTWNSTIPTAADGTKGSITFAASLEKTSAPATPPTPYLVLGGTGAPLNGPAVCPMAGALGCPRDIWGAVGGPPNAFAEKMLLRISIRPTCDLAASPCRGTTTPTLNSWNVTFSCVPK